MPPKRRSTRRSAKAEPEAEEAEATNEEPIEEESEEGPSEESETTEESEPSGKVDSIEESSPEEKMADTELPPMPPQPEPMEEEAPVEQPQETGNTEEIEPPEKKFKVDDALKRIQAEKERIEKEKQEKEEKEKSEKRKELEKYWKPVKDDPSDFTGWTHLLQFVDNRNELDNGREAFNDFLNRYPYCYGYWKKFADFEKRNSTKEKTLEVFERGLAAIPLSVDLWIHYMNYTKINEKETPEKIRTAYDRAIATCGREWRSDKLWDHYLKWEQEEKNYRNIFEIHRKAIKTPSQGAGNQLEACTKFVKETHPKEFLDSVDFLQMRKDVLENLKGKENGEKEGEESGAAPGEDNDSAMLTDEETNAFREKIIAELKLEFKTTEERITMRKTYEDGIKRPYFHVKPLERGQLKNWHDYLEFMKTEMCKEGGDETEVEILFERCLIACALYEEFWMNYLSWYEGKDGDHSEKIRSIFKRACTHHLPSKVDVHCRWATFEESSGNFSAAAEIFEKVEKAHPQLVSLQLRRVNLERRRGNTQEASNLYEAAIKAASEQNVATDLSIKFARFLRLHLRDVDKASDVLVKALETDPKNPKLYLQQLDILLHQAPINIEKVVEVMDNAIKQDLDEKHKFLFSQRKVEFLEDFGPDIDTLQKAQKSHIEMSKKYKESLSSGEKSGDGSGGDAAKDEKNNGSTSFPPVAGGGGNFNTAQNQAFNNYGQRYSGYQGGQGGPAGGQQGNYQGYNNYYQGYGGYGGSGGSGY